MTEPPEPSRLDRLMRITKGLAKRTLLGAGPDRLVQAALELLRAAEPRYTRRTLDALLRDVTARSDTARQAQLCRYVLELWEEGTAFPPYALHALRVVERHLEKVGVAFGPGLSVCELGPGDSLCLAGLIAARGASYVGVDPWGPLLEPDLYRLATTYFLEQEGLDISTQIDTSQDPVRPAAAIQRRASTEGLASDSFDLVFSIAVLEHVREPKRAIAEAYRLLCPGGYALHQIDYEDHRGRGAAGWDFLRFSSAEWDRMHEGERARDYTNRWRHSQWCALIDDLGFEVVETTFKLVAPPPGLQVHADVGALSEDDLNIQSAQFLLRKPEA